MIRRNYYLILVIFVFSLISLSACISPGIEMAVTFESNGGTPVESITYDGVKEIAIPENPTREGYTFDGWFWDNGIFSQPFTVNSILEQRIQSDIELIVYAKWVPIDFIISYVLNGGTNSDSNPTSFNVESSLSIIDPTREGYTFGGWYEDAELTTAFEFTSMPAEDITIYAKWNINSYTLKYVDDDNTVLSTADFEYGADLSEVIAPTVNKVGYTFSGWDISLPMTMPGSDLTLKAQYTVNQYTLTFETNGGTTIAEISQDYNSALIAPTEPTREGYTFGGWYEDAELTTAFEFTSMPAEDITIYAKWNINSYTLKYVDDDNTVLSTADFEYGADLSDVIAPTVNKVGYTFSGWDIALPMTMPGSDLTLKAQYTVNQYRLTFETNGGSTITEISQDYNSALIAPTEPTREGYTFGGWYEDAELTTAFEFTTLPAEDITIYAKWLGLLYYEFEDHIEIYGYNGTEVNVEVPDTISGLPVTKINSNAFANNNTIKSLNIGIYVTSIGQHAFYSTNNLTTLVFKEGSQLTTIGPYAFYNAISLTSIVIPNSITSIEDYAFSNVTSLLSIVIPNSVTSIGEYAFYCATNLSTITFEEGSQLTSIGSNAFREARSLSSIEIPSSVTNIGKNAFNYTNNLIEINVSEDNNFYKSIDGILYTKDLMTLIKYPEGKIETSFTIPSGVSSIGEYAFHVTNNLTSVVVPNTVTIIGNEAFSAMTGLQIITFEENSQLSKIDGFAFAYTTRLSSIVIPNSVTIIESGAFHKATGLTTITFEEGSQLQALGSGVFSEASNLLSITIPNSVTWMGDGVFSGASSLTTVVLPEGITAIGGGTFYNATSLETIVIPANVSIIFTGAFTGASNLNTIYVSEGNGSFKSVDGVLYSNDLTKLIKYPEGKINTSYDILSSVISIEAAAFYGTKNLSSIEIPNSVLSIGENAFRKSISLINIEIPNSVTNIGAWAFSESTALKSIIIPLSVTHIGSNAFYGILGLTIYAEAITMPYGWDVLWNPYNLTVVWGYSVS